MALIILTSQYFIRRATAVSIVNRVRFGGESLKAASDNCIEELRVDGGLGGVIALDHEGNGKNFVICGYYDTQRTPQLLLQ